MFSKYFSQSPSLPSLKNSTPTTSSFDPNSTEPLSFQLMKSDATSDVQVFHKKLEDLVPLPFSDTYCLTGTNTSLKNLEARVSDSLLLKLIKQIETHRFSDEIKSIDEKGNVTIQRKGQSSTRSISYNRICKSGNRYLFFFESDGPNVFIGGGGYPPSGFAYTNNSGELVILEDTFNAISFYGVANDVMYVRSGYGDGPAGTQIIQSLKFANGSVQTVASCEFGIASNGEEFAKCKDGTGNIYYKD